MSGLGDGTETGFEPIRFLCPDDAVPHRVFATPQRWLAEFGFTLTVRFTHQQWKMDPGYLLVHLRQDSYLILSSRGQCGLARIRKYVVESMLDAFEGEWLIPWGPRTAYRKDAPNEIQLILLDGRIEARLNQAAIGNCADDTTGDGLVRMMVCGNRSLESAEISGIAYFDPAGEVPFEGAPCWLEVSIEDRLNTESGAPSAPGRTKVYWLVPLDWANAPGRNARVRRFVEKQYERMNAEASAQRVRYTVLSVRSAIVYEDDIPRGAARRRLKADGSTEEW